jgi:hypothetical protein
MTNKTPRERRVPEGGRTGEFVFFLFLRTSKYFYLICLASLEQLFFATYAPDILCLSIFGQYFVCILLKSYV